MSLEAVVFEQLVILENRDRAMEPLTSNLMRLAWSELFAGTAIA